MKTIDEYKKEILLRIMSGEKFSYFYIGTLPKNDEMRTFICELGPEYAYGYARYTDKSPHDETRKAACGDPVQAFWYAYCVDKSPRDDTRKAAYRDPYHKQIYVKRFGE